MILDPGQLGPCVAKYAPNKIEYGWGPCTVGLGGALYSGEGGEGGSAGPGTCKKGTDGHINIPAENITFATRLAGVKQGKSKFMKDF